MEMGSTLILTLLLMVGLFFFIRASVKDRTEAVTLISSATEDKTLEYLKQYFQKRAYKVIDIDGENNKVILEGFVSPSLFLAILLSCLAACGLFCLNLVLSYLYPSSHNLFVLLTLLSPLAGFFYWQNAGRLEKIALKLESPTDRQEEKEKSVITIIAHRDELIELQQSFPFQFSTK
jgi:Flp pilus assembly protein TadB